MAYVKYMCAMCFKANYSCKQFLLFFTPFCVNLILISFFRLAYRFEVSSIPLCSPVLCNASANDLRLSRLKPNPLIVYQIDVLNKKINK